MSHSDRISSRSRRFRHFISPTGLTVLAFLAAACSGSEDAASTTVAATAPTTVATTTTTVAPTTTVPPTTAPATTTSTTSTTTTTLPPVYRQPLTGAVIPAPTDIIDRPALAVKIDNAPGARRNHVGLGKADIVFEEIVEGSITRFAAVFHTNDSDPVGPIRSGRSQDVDLLTSFNSPLFAWSGGNAGVSRLIAESSLTDLNWQKNGGSYYRGSGSTPHNLYSSTERLRQLSPPDSEPPPQQFQYLRPEQTFRGAETSGVDLALRGIDVGWTWDEASGTFLRSQEGGPHMDVQNGQISATNLILMVVEYKPSAIDARSPEAQTIGNGPLYVLSDGKVVEGRWFRETADAPIQLLGAKNAQIPLQPGNTWIELMEAFVTDDNNNPESTVRVRPA